MESFVVSVIVPVFNGEAYLAEAIRSIQAQDCTVQEIVVVDDGSTDGTACVIDGFGAAIRPLRQTNRGAAAARNRGIGVATGDIIAFLDADDLWVERRLSLAFHRLREDPLLQLVRGYTQRIRRRSDPGAGVDWEPVGPAWPALSLGATVVRRTVFDTVGGFDESLAMNEDVDWFVRVQETGIPALVHHDVVQLYRRHEHNITNDVELNRALFLRTLKNSIARKRDRAE